MKTKIAILIALVALSIIIPWSKCSKINDKVGPFVMESPVAKGIEWLIEKHFNFIFGSLSFSKENSKIDQLFAENDRTIRGAILNGLIMCGLIIGMALAFFLTIGISALIIEKTPDPKRKYAESAVVIFWGGVIWAIGGWMILILLAFAVGAIISLCCFIIELGIIGMQYYIIPIIYLFLWLKPWKKFIFIKE